jgi:hypothetical protein
VLKPVVARYQGKASRIYFRADAAFAMPGVYDFLEAEGIEYATRLPANQILQNRIAPLLRRPIGRPPQSVRRLYASFRYKAGGVGASGRGTHAGIPPCHRRPPVIIEYTGTDLQEMMAATLGPAHPLFLHEPPTEDLVDGGLDERRRDRFATSRRNLDLQVPGYGWSCPNAAARVESGGRVEFGERLQLEERHEHGADQD